MIASVHDRSDIVRIGGTNALSWPRRGRIRKSRARRKSGAWPRCRQWRPLLAELRIRLIHVALLRRAERCGEIRRRGDPSRIAMVVGRRRRWPGGLRSDWRRLGNATGEAPRHCPEGCLRGPRYRRLHPLQCVGVLERGSLHSRLRLSGLRRLYLRLHTAGRLHSWQRSDSRHTNGLSSMRRLDSWNRPGRSLRRRRCSGRVWRRRARSRSSTCCHRHDVCG